MALFTPLVVGSATLWFEILILRRMMSGRNATRFSRPVRSLLVVCAFTVAVLMVLLLYNASIERIAFGSGESEDTAVDFSKQTLCSGRQFDYGIMFDAGSTGSRLHVFKFQCVPTTGRFTLVGELFEAVKPGLSSYAENPDKGAESLRPLVEKACTYIPKDQWAETPIGLKATAGLRLLSNTTAHQLLYKVDQLFRSYSFKMTNKSVSILEGTDEGLFCWFTVNFLHGFVDGSSSSSNKMGVLDLGGGSTQVTFLSSAAVRKSEKRMVAVEVFGKMYTLYSHSYLGLGLNSGRFQAFGGKETPEGIVPGTFESTCLPDNYKNIWEYGGKKHSLSFISRKENGTSSRFENCYATVQRVIKSYQIDSMAELTSAEFYALSYYFDKAKDAKLVDSEDRAKLTVNHYHQAARQECQRVTKEDPFRCLDLCYITALLQDGFGLPRTSTLHLGKKIRDVEIQWPLGAMFSVFGQLRRLPRRPS